MSHASESPKPAPQTGKEDTPRFASGVGNRLLSALPAAEYVHLARFLEDFQPPLQYVYYQPDEVISHVYFVNSGVASLLVMDDADGVVEVGTVGNEGMVGIPVFLGQDATPSRALMQVPGSALRMSVADFRREVVDQPGSHLQLLLQRYTHALMVQMAQGVLCNRLHTLEQRAARWLLMTRDRVGGPTFPLTQEFLAQMLGVRRAGVSEAASALQQAELISYIRGVISILDATGLEERACGCYHIIRDAFDQVLVDR